MQKKENKVLSTIGEIFIVIVLGAMVLMVFVNAVARYAFTTNFPVFEELSRYLFVWVAFLGAMLAYKEGKHVGIDMLVGRLHGVPKLVIKLVCQLAIFVCLAIIGLGSYHYFALTASDPSPSAGIPFGMISGMAILLTIYMLIISVQDTFSVFKAFKAGEYDISDHEKEKLAEKQLVEERGEE
ncbi:MAG: TRAP transporter small permease [Firmicutes bacterium]|nr:TRAP transporter small permease [Bacillota bacterium]